MNKPFATATVAVAAWMCLATQAFALDPYEIQVYQAEVNRPWQPGLEIHSNYTIRGTSTPDYPGQLVPDRTARLTLEPALGVTEFLELGAYLMLHASPEQSGFAGWKLRTKWVVPRRMTGQFFLGINSEVGRVRYAVESNGWANEFRPIIGWENARWFFDVNPIFGYALSGPDKFKPDFEPAGKVGWKTRHGFMLGAEYYAGLGLLSNGLAPLSQQEHLVFATFDLVEAEEAEEAADTESGEEPWELNLAIGRSLTDATPSQWQIKTIVGRAF